jgi:hypothetical protein
MNDRPGEGVVWFVRLNTTMSVDLHEPCAMVHGYEHKKQVVLCN